MRYNRLARFDQVDLFRLKPAVSPDRIPGGQDKGISGRQDAGNTAGQAINQADREIIARRMKEIAFKYRFLSQALPARTALPGKIAIEAERFRRCGSEFAVHECPTDQHKFRIPSTCKSRICPDCARKYGATVQDQISKIIRRYMAQSRRGWCVSLLTLTFDTKQFKAGYPNQKELSRIGGNLSDFMRLFYGRYKSHRTASGKVVEDKRRTVLVDGKKIKRPVRTRTGKNGQVVEDYRIYRGAGGISVLECGHNGNLHFHCVVYGPYIPQRILSAAWYKITGNSFVVDIRPVRHGSREAISYLLKYITKPPLHDSYFDLAMYAFLLKGLRRIRQFGVMYNSIRMPKRKGQDLYCLYCGSPLNFRGVHDDPHNKLIDWLAFKKYTDPDAGAFMRLPYGRSRDLDWMPYESEVES